MAWQENVLLVVRMFGCIHLVIPAFQENAGITMLDRMTTLAMVASKTWVNTTNESILSSKDIVDGGKTKAQNHAQDIIRAHLVVARRGTNHQRPQHMNYLKMRLMMMRTLHKKLHRFLIMTIKKVRSLRSFQTLLNQ